MTLPSCRAADTCEEDAGRGIPAAVGVARAVDAGAAASLRASTPPRSEAMPAAVRRDDLGPRGAFGITVPPLSIQSLLTNRKVHAAVNRQRRGAPDMAAGPILQAPSPARGPRCPRIPFVTLVTGPL